MPTFDSYPPGTPCWIDLMSPDVDESKAFYGAVFGWSADDQYDGDTRVYTNFQLDGKNVCGLAAQGPEMAGAPPVWSTYVATADVDATVAKVEAAGGSVMMPPMDVMETVGRMAIVADPTGAVIGLWQGGDHKGADVANEADTWSWNELLSRDLSTAQKFYADVLGWTYESNDMGGGMTYHVIEGGENNGLGGMMDMPPDMPDMVPNHWMVYFMTADVDATLAKATDAGGMIAQEPFEVPGVGRMAVVHDPQGGSFSLLQPADA